LAAQLSLGAARSARRLRAHTSAPASVPISLRANVSIVSSGAESNETAAEIKAKWDKMDEFLKIMFQIACKWKHKNDVQGEAKEQFTKG